MQTVASADGTTIAYDSQGDGPPLCCLHGGGTRRFWEPLTDALADAHCVIRPDRRGRGDSGDGPTYSIEREIEDCCAVIEAIDGTPTLIGHSFGGLLALEVAQRRAVQSVVAYEPAYLVGEYRNEASLSETMQRLLDDGRPRAAAKAHLREVIHGGDAPQFEAWLEEWPGWPASVAFVENNLRMDRALESFELDDSLEIDAPALLLSGNDGPQHLRDSIRVVDERLPDSEFIEFDGVGHLGPITAPNRFLDAVGHHLETVM